MIGLAGFDAGAVGVSGASLQPGAIGELFPVSDHDPGPAILFNYFAESERDWCRANDGSFVTVRAVPLPYNYLDPVGVVVERYDADGIRLGEPITVNPAPARYLPQIACNGSGDFVVSWSDQVEGERLLRVYARSGKPLSAPVEMDGWNPWMEGCRLAGLGLSPQRFVVAMAACSRNGEGQDPANHFDVRVVSADGQRLGEHRDFIVPLENSWFALEAAIAIDGDGNALVVARADAARVLVNLADGGEPLGEAFAPLPYANGAHAEAVRSGLFRLMVGDAGDWSALWVSLDGTAPPVTLIPDPKPDESFRREVIATAARVEPHWWSLPPPDLSATHGSWVLAQAETWTDVGTDRPRSSSAVTVRRSVDQGRTWAEPVVLSPQEWRTGIPDLASDEHGSVVATWLVDEGYRTWVYASSSSDGGKTWSAAVEVSVETFSDHACNNARASRAHVATDGYGQWVVVWGQQQIRDDCSERNVGLHDALFASRSTDGGATWEPPNAIAWEAGYGRYGLDVVADGKGNWVVAWSDDAVRTSRSSNGVSWSEPVQRTPSDVPTSLRTDTEKFYLERDQEPERRVSLASNGAGSVLLAAISSTQDPDRFGHDADLYTWLSEDGGNRWRDPRAVASWAGKDGRRDRWPKLARDGRGGWTLAWQTDRLLVSRSRDGLSWEEPRSIGSPVFWAKPGAVVSSSGVTMVASSVPVEATPDSTGVEIRVAIAGDSCGDGRTEAGEVCDDGSSVNGDGCDENCTATSCGNGITSSGEECDDGNASDEDGCTTLCRRATCGDGIRRIDVEACDDGNDSNADGCLVGCVPAYCGDGFVATGEEQCDDGHWDTSDDCVRCRFATCGDGFVHPSTEECDDTNTVTQDACTADCRLARCGDGSWHIGVEECDASVDEHADYCTSDCRLAICPDADANSVISASDAIRILGRSVGLDSDCPLAACDADRDGRIGVNDARLTLRDAVGVTGDAICGGGSWPPLTGEVAVHLADFRTFGAVQIDLEYPLSVDLFDASGEGKPDCVSDVPGLRAFHSAPGKLTAGFATLEGVHGVRELFRCRYYGIPPGGGEFFRATLVDVIDLDGEVPFPPPKIVVSRW